MGAGRDSDALCRPQQHRPSSSPGTVILSAEALAARRAKQAQRRAQQVPAQLSKEQEELVRTLLGAHSRHVGTMFNQFVQFRVSLCMDFELKEDQKGTRGGCPEGGGSSVPRPKTEDEASPEPQRPQAPRPRSPSKTGLERPLGLGPLTQALISAASCSSVHPSPAPARPGPRTAPAHALRGGQHLHGTASHQIHQGRASLPVRDLPLPSRRKTLQ